MPENDDGQAVDLDAEYAAALNMLPDLWREVVSSGRDPSRFVLELKDPTGALLLCVPFTDLMQAESALN
jgi:hypothetical protein